MAGFRYFVPGKHPAHFELGDQQLHREALHAHGLGRTLADCERLGVDLVLVTIHAQGPDGGGGTLLVPQPADPSQPAGSATYRRDKQTWLQAEDSPLWIGWDTESPPSPSELLRKSALKGHAVRDLLDDGWQIPVARNHSLVYGWLPQQYKSERGKWVGRLKAEYRELWERACQLWQLYAWSQGQAEIERGEAVSPGEPPAEWFSPAWLVEQACWLLGVNYRVGPLEINALFDAGRPLLDDRFKHAVCQAACDFDFLLELQKKTAESTSVPVPAGLNSTPGDEGDSQATAPA